MKEHFHDKKEHFNDELGHIHDNMRHFQDKMGTSAKIFWLKSGSF